MEETGFSEMLITIYWTTWCHNSADHKSMTMDLALDMYFLRFWNSHSKAKECNLYFIMNFLKTKFYMQKQFGKENEL
jgi:hypothetical protein